MLPSKERGQVNRFGEVEPRQCTGVFADGAGQQDPPNEFQVVQSGRLLRKEGSARPKTNAPSAASSESVGTATAVRYSKMRRKIPLLSLGMAFLSR